MSERAQPGWRLGQALSLLAEVVPLRAGHEAAGADDKWSATIGALRRLSSFLVPDRDVLFGRDRLIDAAARAENLERRLVELQKQAKEQTAGAGVREASPATARDACRAQLLAALRTALGLGVDEWTKQAVGRAEHLKQSLEGCGGSDAGAVDFAAARAALDSALEEAASWEKRHDPQAWAAASEQSRVAFKNAATAQGGLDALTDPLRLSSLRAHIDAMCSALMEEKTRLKTDKPGSDIPRASADRAVGRVRAYIKAAAGAVGELRARFERLVERLTFYSQGESRPGPAAQLERLLGNLHTLEDNRDDKTNELGQAERKIKRSGNVSQEQSEQKAKLEAELTMLSKRISELDRRATGERAKLLRHAEAHFPELLFDRAWLQAIGLGEALDATLDLARCGVLRSGARFSDYAQQKILQDGGGKTVYHVKDDQGRDLVLKRFVLGSADAQRHFFRQAGLLRSLSHSNLVTVESVFVDAQFGYLVMPFYSGGDLAAWLKATPATARSPEQCKQIARDLVNGLRGLHAAGVVHCDIKPSNVLLTRGGQALIGDFDGARKVDVTMTRVRDLQVTLKYLAPEFLSGKAKDATKAMDVFALGMLLGELLHGIELGPAAGTLLARMGNANPLERPAIEDVARDALFDARPVELRDCRICYDKRRLEDGLECAEQHFVCRDCLEGGLSAYLKPDSEQDPRVGRDLSVGCLQGRACGARLAARDLARLVSDATLAKVREREQGRRETELQKQLQSEFDERLKAELARKVEDVIVGRHRDHICELLEPSCPRCKRRFIDFEGCFALTCSGNGGCGCGFCAYCLEDCGNDAHNHVAACPGRPPRQPSGDMVHDRYYGSEAEFKAAMKALSTRRVREYWRSEVAKLPVEQRRQLAERIRPLLKDVTEHGLAAEIK